MYHTQLFDSFEIVIISIITVYVLLNVCIDYIEDTENLFGKIKTKYVILYCVNMFEPF